MKVLVCGSRHITDRSWVYEILGLMHKQRGFTEVIQGDCRGVDKFAHAWAQNREIKCTTFPANWKKYGRAAGPVRNRQMLDEGRPDLVIAFPIPSGRGTQNMMKQARERGIEVHKVEVV